MSSVMEQELMALLSERVHQAFASADAAGVPGYAFGDLETVADAMSAALPGSHFYDQTVGPFYDTAGLSRWLGVSRQALNKKVAAHSLIACPLEDGQLVYPVWQFTSSGSVHPAVVTVWRILRASADAWTCALWMCAPSDDLDGKTAAQWLVGGYALDPVAQAATADAQRWAA